MTVITMQLEEIGGPSVKVYVHISTVTKCYCKIAQRIISLVYKLVNYAL